MCLTKSLYGGNRNINELSQSLKDDEEEPEIKEVTKKGWSVFPVPIVSYNSDEGFQITAFVNLYDYGNGSMTPDYRHLLSFQFSYYTKGSNLFYFNYDSKYLIPNMRVGFNASYITNTVLNFYGFNGYASPLDKSLNSRFYAHDRRMLRIMGDLQGPIAENLTWAAGIIFYDFKTRAVKGYSNSNLYQLYVDNGIIGERESRGGSHIEFRAGMAYDTRDNEFDPSEGLYIEGFLLGSPDIFNKEHEFSYLHAGFSFRHFIPVVYGKLTFAYNFSYQGRIAGNIPFYRLPVYSMLTLRTTNPTLLGGGNTIRGVNLSRIVSNGVVWANAEIRWKFVRFNLIKQDVQLGLAPFIDAGRSISPYRLEEMKATNNPQIWSGHAERLHVGAGIGFKIILNGNMVVSVDAGMPFSGRDGKLGLYFTMNYLF